LKIPQQNDAGGYNDPYGQLGVVQKWRLHAFKMGGSE